MSISSLYNHGYIAVFDRGKVTIIKEYNIIMQGTRHHKSGLLMIYLKQNSRRKGNKLNEGKYQDIGKMEEDIKTSEDIIKNLHKIRQK